MIIKKIGILFLNSLKKICLLPIAIFRYLVDLMNFCLKNQKGTIYSMIPIRGILPMILDRYMSDGNLDKHYFLQDIYVASKIIEMQPEDHYDVGSRVDGFVAHLLSALKGKITIIDIRPLLVSVEGLSFIQADATNLDNIEDASLKSLSSLHAVEHFGLGRYGDPINPESCFTAMKSMQRVLAPEGLLYFSVPIGKEDAVYFNSHRMFKPRTILDTFDEMDLLEFSYINNYEVHTLNGSMAQNSILNDMVQIENYDCGIFIFRKR